MLSEFVSFLMAWWIVFCVSKNCIVRRILWILFTCLLKSSLRICCLLTKDLVPELKSNRPRNRLTLLNSISRFVLNYGGQITALFSLLFSCNKQMSALESLRLKATSSTVHSCADIQQCDHEAGILTVRIGLQINRSILHFNSTTHIK